MCIKLDFSLMCCGGCSFKEYRILNTEHEISNMEHGILNVEVVSIFDIPCSLFDIQYPSVFLHNQLIINLLQLDKFIVKVVEIIISSK
jgi:hypothetical protein